MGAVWLFFLGFPIIAVLDGDDYSPPVQVAALALIVAFAVAYVFGFVRGWGGVTRRWLPGGPVGWFLLLAAIVVATAALIGDEALGMAPFLVAYAVFVLPRRAAVVAVAAIFTVAAVAASVGGWWSDLWFLFGVMALLVVVGTIVRGLEVAEETHRALERDHELVTERERMARDVHDVLGHSLTVVSVKAELAGRLVDVDPARAKEEIADIQRLARTSLGEIRATVAGLRVARLDEELATAADALAGAGVEAVLPDDVAAVDPRHRLVLAWVLREAVTNVVRHSAATRCTVTLGPDRLRVEDDGRGSAQLREGNGLRGIRERVAAAGGAIEVESVPGSGTRVEVRL
ncbi:sensor histidine kinase [Nocardioides sambongensis]|uniref:sensor histidine kinase n=1 Tax=Nocardioides sambongensis TaxID=2589074 RepID=UPI00112A5F48|nr:sensor histidine kinase [Nocardioides sambongensis]